MMLRLLVCTRLYCVCMKNSLTVCLAVCSSRLTGGHVEGQPCDDQLIVEEEKIKAQRERGVRADG